MTKQISGGRKLTYYIGKGMIVLGVILFASTFLTFIAHFGDFSNFESNAKSGAARAFGGMALMIAGAVIGNIGARGLAGSGVVLDPEEARRDLEPYTRMAGGMVKDALDEADVHIGSAPEKVVMLKCPSCSTLNDEDARFCKECGAKL